MYEKFDEGMLLSKDAKYNVLEQHQVKFKEDDEMLYRFSGSALQKMIKLREETIAGKQGRRKATSLSIEFISVIREMDNSVREFLNLENVNKYPGKLLELNQNTVSSNKDLEKLFKEKFTEVSSKDLESDVADKMYRDLVSKVANTRTKEFMMAWTEQECMQSGKVVDTDQSLHDKLKTFSATMHR